MSGNPLGEAYGEINRLNRQINQLENENEMLRRQLNKAEEKISDLTFDNEELKSQLKCLSEARYDGRL